MKRLTANDAGPRIFQRRYSRDRLWRYLIPVVIGFGGVAFSVQLADLYVRIIVLLLSVSIPLYASGTLLARYKARRIERFFLGIGLLLLIFGAALSVAGFATSIVIQPSEWFAAENISRFMGVSSVMLGLFTVMYSIGRTGEDIDEIGERFWHLAQHMHEGVVLSDQDGTIIMVNQQFGDMTGLDPNEVLQTNIRELAKRFDLSEVESNIEKRKHGLTSEYEIRFSVNGDERHFIINGKPILDKHGKLTATLATVRDRTREQRLTQRVERYANSLEELVAEQTQKLRQSRRRLRQLLLNMSEGFFTLDENLRITFANERICEILGRPSEELLGGDIIQLVDAPGKVRLLNLLTRDPGKHAATMRQELTFVTSDGAPVPTMTAIGAVREGVDPGGPRFSLVITDISELKSLEQELRRRAEKLQLANEELRRHDRAKDGFLSNVSHELRTPLSTVQGYIELLESGGLGPLEPKQHDALLIVHRNLSRLGGLINEMIDFSRMEIRGVELEWNLFGAAELLREGVDSALPQATDKQITLGLDATGPDALVWGDRPKLMQVLAILLHNALKFTGAGGRVSVHAGRDAGGSLTISVDDTGIGIDPAYHERIFHKFFQVDSSKARRYEGAGIGLSIAKNIVEAHGGAISISSQAGQGSTFTVRLPATMVYEESRDESAPWSEWSFALIDAEPISGASLRRVLAHTGAEISLFEAPHQLIRAADQDPPQLLIINTDSRDRVGGALERVLGNHPVLSQSPRLYLTETPAEFWPGPLERSEQASYLLKPFQRAGLLRAVESALHPGQTEVFSPAPAKETSVLVIDSDPHLLQWLDFGLSLRQTPCSTATTIAHGLLLARNTRPRAIFIDADSPDSPPEALLKGLAESPALAQVPVFAMTGVAGGGRQLAAMSGVLSKPFTLDELMQKLSPTDAPDDVARAS
jgi:PAS domain S-box-containing protein